MIIQLARTGARTRLKRGRDDVLFTTKPKKPSVGFYDDLRSLTWINGRGKELAL